MAVEALWIVARIVAFLAGLGLVVYTVLSAIRTFVLPRGAPDRLTTFVFLSLSLVFRPASKDDRPYEQRDRIMALFAPIALLTLPVVWLALCMIGYTGIYWSVGVAPLGRAFTVSGSSLLTLGFAADSSFPAVVVTFTEAALGMILVALLIAYLPTMYGAFSRREVAVSMLHVRASTAGGSPSAVEMLRRFHALGRLDKFNEMWTTWEIWFNELDETHTSLPAMAFFRSPRPERSWITAAGVVLDAAALLASCADLPRDPQAELCIRSGFMALRDIADYFGIRHNRDPAPTDPINITRSDFDFAYDQLAEVGFPLKTDRDQAWRDFAGWRVNYDRVLLSLADLTMAPPAPWITDRALRVRRSLTYLLRWRR